MSGHLPAGGDTAEMGVSGQGVQGGGWGTAYAKAFIRFLKNIIKLFIILKNRNDEKTVPTEK